MIRIAGWPASDALVASVTGRPVAAVSCTDLLRLQGVGIQGEPDTTRARAVAIGAHARANSPRIPLDGLDEVSQTYHARTETLPSPGLLLDLWDLNVQCGAMLALLAMGYENEGEGADSLADYVRSWHRRGMSAAHAVWHIVDGSADPQAVRRHRARGCTPVAFMTLWGLAGRGPSNDPLLSAGLYWLRASHRSSR